MCSGQSVVALLRSWWQRWCSELTLAMQRRRDAPGWVVPGPLPGMDDFTTVSAWPTDAAFRRMESLLPIDPLHSEVGLESEIWIPMPYWSLPSKIEGRMSMGVCSICRKRQLGF